MRFEILCLNCGYVRIGEEIEQCDNCSNKFDLGPKSFENCEKIMKAIKDNGLTDRCLVCNSRQSFYHSDDYV